MTDFKQLCEARQRAGLALYRAGDESALFVGDPIREALDETADLANYASAAQEIGVLSPLAAEHVRDLAEQAHRILSILGKEPTNG